MTLVLESNRDGTMEYHHHRHHYHNDNDRNGKGVRAHPRCLSFGRIFKGPLHILHPISIMGKS